MVEKFKRVYEFAFAFGSRRMDSGYINDKLIFDGEETIFETKDLPSKKLELGEIIYIDSKRFEISKIVYDPKENIQIVVLRGSDAKEDFESFKKAHKELATYVSESHKREENRLQTNLIELREEFNTYKNTYTRKGWFR